MRTHRIGCPAPYGVGECGCFPMKNRLYERIGYAYVVRQVIERAVLTDGEMGGAGGKAYVAVDAYLQGIVREAIRFGIDRGQFALKDFQLDSLEEEFARAVYRITRIEAQKPPTIGDVIRAKLLAWKRRALAH